MPPKASKLPDAPTPSKHFMKTISMAKKKNKLSAMVHVPGLSGSDTAAQIAKLSKAERKKEAKAKTKAKAKEQPASAPQAKKAKVAKGVPAPAPKPVPVAPKAAAVPVGPKALSTSTSWVQLTGEGPTPSGYRPFTFGKSGTERPALNLLCGISLPQAVNPSHAIPVLSKILAELWSRHKKHGLITEGRTLDFRRIRFELEGPIEQHRLYKCFFSDHVGKLQKHEHICTSLENELFYLVAWNRHAFPELTSNKKYSQLYPALFPGNTTSMLRILEADGVKLEALEPQVPSRCGWYIFTILLTYVQTNSPDSPLLRANTTSIRSGPPIPETLGFGAAQQTDHNSQNGENGTGNAISDEYLTLALTPKNFYTALVQTLEEFVPGKLKTEEDRKEAVEALMYRLAVKDPLAFAEFFSIVSVTAHETKGGK